MADIIESPARSERRRRWPNVLVAVVMLGASAGDAVLERERSRERPEAESQASERTEPPPIAVAPGGAELPTLAIPPGIGPAGLRISVGGSDPVQVDAATGGVRPILGLDLAPADSAELVPVGDATVALVHTASVGGPGYAVVLDDGQARPLLDRADAVYPLAGSGVLAATFPRPGQPGELVGLSLDGTVLWQREHPDAVVVGATALGVLTVERSGTGVRTIRLVDAATGLVLRDIGPAARVLASDTRRVAWIPDTDVCQWSAGSGSVATDCEVVVTELHTGAELRFALPPDQPGGRAPGAGAFAPDGSALALGFPGWSAPTPGGLDLGGYVAVLDLTSGVLRRLPGVTTPGRDVVGLAWSDDSRTLVVAIRWPDHVWLALWQPATDDVVALAPEIADLATQPPSVSAT